MRVYWSYRAGLLATTKAPREFDHRTVNLRSACTDDLQLDQLLHLLRWAVCIKTTTGSRMRDHHIPVQPEGREFTARILWEDRFVRK